MVQASIESIAIYIFLKFNLVKLLIFAYYFRYQNVSATDEIIWRNQYYSNY